MIKRIMKSIGVSLILLLITGVLWFGWSLPHAWVFSVACSGMPAQQFMVVDADFKSAELQVEEYALKQGGCSKISSLKLIKELGRTPYKLFGVKPVRTTTMSLTTLEKQVLEKLLEENLPFAQDLRLQLPGLEVISRQFTGVGFFTNFQIDRSLISEDIMGKSFSFGDVRADVKGLKHGAGFVLFVKDGAMACLEGYTYDEKWPEKIGRVELRHLGVGTRDSS